MEKNTEAASNAADEPSLRDTLESELEKAAAPEPETEEAKEPEEPAEEVEASEAEDRDEKGRFKKGKKAKKAEEGEEAEEAPEEPTEAAPATKMAPPPGWSATAKAEFNKLPKPVQEAVAKREEEINKGFSVLKGYKQLDPYVQMAERSGTSLPEALERYVAAEQFLERDPLSGIKWLCQNYNLDPRQLIDGQAQANQQAMPQPQPAQADPTQYLSPIMQKLSQLEQVVVGEQQAKVGAEIDDFFSDTANYPYAENVADQMANLLRVGQAEDLKQAYDMACWIDPEVRGLMISETESKKNASQAAKAKATANQARNAGNSISGGPATTPDAGALQNADDLRSQIEKLWSGPRV